MIGVSSPSFNSKNFIEIWDEISKDFSHWEIFSETNHSLEKVLPVFLENKDSYNMTYSVHSPIGDTNIAALTDKIREASIEVMIDTMKHANTIGAEVVTIHPGVYSFSIPGHEAMSLKLAKESLLTLEKSARDFGTTLVVENMPSLPIMIGQEAKELEYLLEGTNLQVCFDIGHAHTSKQMNEMIGLFKDRISNIHIHDNDGSSDKHLTIGEGSIDFNKVISKLEGYKGNYIIESKSLESARDSHKILKAMLM